MKNDKRWFFWSLLIVIVIMLGNRWLSPLVHQSLPQSLRIDPLLTHVVMLVLWFFLAIYFIKWTSQRDRVTLKSGKKGKVRLDGHLVKIELKAIKSALDHNGFPWIVVSFTIYSRLGLLDQLTHKYQADQNGVYDIYPFPTSDRQFINWNLLLKAKCLENGKIRFRLITT